MSSYRYALNALTDNDLAPIAADFRKLVKPLRRVGVNLRGADGRSRLIINDELIEFNGEAFCSHPDSFPCHGSCDLSGEAFRLEYNAFHGWLGKDWIHYKTNTRSAPYDLAVQAALVIAKHHLKDDIQITANIEEEFWEGEKLCDRTFGYQDFSLSGTRIEAGNSNRYIQTSLEKDGGRYIIVVEAVERNRKDNSTSQNRHVWNHHTDKKNAFQLLNKVEKIIKAQNLGKKADDKPTDTFTEELASRLEYELCEK